MKSNWHSSFPSQVSLLSCCLWIPRLLQSWPLGFLESCKCESLSNVWLSVTSWTVAHQAPQSMEFSMQEFWSGLPFSSLGSLSPVSLFQTQDIHISSPLFPWLTLHPLDLDWLKISPSQKELLWASHQELCYSTTEYNILLSNDNLYWFIYWFVYLFIICWLNKL